jgi:hypothetical protein
LTSGTSISDWSGAAPREHRARTDGCAEGPMRSGGSFFCHDAK